MDDYKQTQYDIREHLIDRAPEFTGGRNRKRKKQERIAYLTAMMHVGGPYANTRSVVSYLRGHTHDRKFFLYNYGSADESLVKSLKGFRYRSFAGSYEEKIAGIMSACERDGIDVLISDMYWSIPLVLFKMRAAPWQYYFSMGFQKFPADKVILMDTMEPFDEDCHQVPYTVAQEFLYRKEAPIEKVADFGTLARLEKASPDFCETVKEIEAGTEKRFCIWGNGTLPGVARMPPDSPHRVLPTLDVFLDPFPLCGCMASFEAQAHGVPVVTLSNPATKSYDRHKPLVVETREEYVNQAVKLLGSEDYRKAISEIGLQKVDKIMDCQKGARAIEELWS